MGLYTEGAPRPRWNFLVLLTVPVALFGSERVASFTAHMWHNSASFLVPYYVWLITLALPAMYLQLRLGGTTGQGMLGIFSKHASLLKGLALACFIRMFILITALSSTSSLCVYYMFASLHNPYQWLPDPNRNNTNAAYYNMTPDVYFKKDVVQLSGGISDEGGFPWYLPLCLLAVFFVIFLMVCGNSRWFGWALFSGGFVAIILCTALLAYGREELKHGRPETHLYAASREKLVTATSKDNEPYKLVHLWMEGVVYVSRLTVIWYGIFPTIGQNAGPGAGRSVLALAAMMLGLSLLPHLFVNTMATYLFALVEEKGFTITDKTMEDRHVLFVVMPTVFAKLDLGRGLAFIFYFFLALLNILQQGLYMFVILQNLAPSTIRSDTKYRAANYFARALFLCVVTYLLTLPQVTQGGLYLTDLVLYSVDRLFFAIVLLTLLVFIVAFAKNKFSTGEKLLVCFFVFIGGVATAGILAFYEHFEKEVQPIKGTGRGGVPYTYPEWAYILHWFIAGSPLLVGLVLGMLHSIGKRRCCDGTPHQADDSGAEFDYDSFRKEKMPHE